jgi:hypothetical protein
MVEGRRNVRALSAYALVLASVVPAAAQEATASASQPAAQVTLSLADVIAPPEWEMRVGLTMATAEGTQVGRVRMRVGYPSKVLQFVRVESSEELKGAGLELRAEPAKGTAAAETSWLDVEVPASAPPKALTAGRLGTLLFKVAGNAEARDWPLTIEDVHAWGVSSPSAELKAAAAPAAKMTVAPPGLPIFACFFYMH